MTLTPEEQTYAQSQGLYLTAKCTPPLPFLPHFGAI